MNTEGKRASVTDLIASLSLLVILGMGCVENRKMADNKQPSDAENLAGQLIRTFDHDEKIRLIQQIGALKTEGSPGVPGLISSLGTSNKKMTDEVAEALARIGSAAVPSVVKATTDSDIRVQADALYVLRKIGPITPEVVPAIAAALSGPNRDLCQIAAFQLEELGPDAADAIPALQAVAKIKDNLLQQQVRRSLSRISPKLFGDSPWYLIENSWNAYCIVGPSDGVMTKELITCLSKLSTSETVQVEAIRKSDLQSIHINETTAIVSALPKSNELPCTLEFVKLDGKWLLARIVRGALILPPEKQ